MTNVPVATPAWIAMSSEGTCVYRILFTQSCALVVMYATVVHYTCIY